MFFELILFILGSLTYSLLSFLPNLAKDGSGWSWEPASVVFFAELLKFLMSFGFLCKETLIGQEKKSADDRANNTSSSSKDSVLNDGRYSTANILSSFQYIFSVDVFTQLMQCTVIMFIPSAMYSVNNTLDIVLTQHMNSVTQQIMLQNKILITSIAWWIIFRRPIELKQWFALVLLTLGSAIASVNFKAVLSDSALKSGSFGVLDLLRAIGSRMEITSMGLMLAFLYCWCSAGASLSTEWIYKKSKPGQSINIQNMGMYIGGLATSYCGFIWQQYQKGGEINYMISTRGWNGFTYIDCMNKACLGLTLGFVMKYMGNIQKLFMFGASMFVAAALSVSAPIILQLLKIPTSTQRKLLRHIRWQPQLNNIIGMVIILVSLALYNWTIIKKTMSVTKESMPTSKAQNTEIEIKKKK